MQPSSFFYIVLSSDDILVCSDTKASLRRLWRKSVVFLDQAWRMEMFALTGTDHLKRMREAINPEVQLPLSYKKCIGLCFSALMQDFWFPPADHHFGLHQSQHRSPEAVVGVASRRYDNDSRMEEEVQIEN